MKSYQCNTEYVSYSGQVVSGSDNLIMSHTDVPAGLGKPLAAFMKLLICREVYRDGWKPNWKSNETKYVIIKTNVGIMPNTSYSVNAIFSFPTEEIRDLFLNNFKVLLEEAQEFI